MTEDIHIKLYIIGVGPGAKDYLLPIARRGIEKAECLIGARRMLSLFQYPDKEKIYLEGHFNNALEYIKKNKDKKRIAVLVRGDPGLYSFLGQVSCALRKDEYVVIPGVSAVQIAFARIGESWQDAKIISLHGRSLGGLVKEVKSSPKVFLFTDSRRHPGRIASYLLDRRTGNRKAVVFENLTYPEERIIDTDFKNLSKMKGFGLCVMIIKKIMRNADCRMRKGKC